jgi:hypothetical protein
LRPITYPFPIDIEASQDDTDRQEEAESATENVSGDVPQPREADAKDGKHGYKNTNDNIVSRIFNDPNKGPIGKWKDEQAAYDAVANLDVSKMKSGVAYSVPIAEGRGEIHRYNPDATVDGPARERITIDPTDRAVVIRKDNSPKIHTFPAGPESSGYSNPAPLK